MKVRCVALHATPHQPQCADNFPVNVYGYVYGNCTSLTETCSQIARWDGVSVVFRMSILWTHLPDLIACHNLNAIAASIMCIQELQTLMMMMHSKLQAMHADTLHSKCSGCPASCSNRSKSPEGLLLRFLYRSKDHDYRHHEFESVLGTPAASDKDEQEAAAVGDNLSGDQAGKATNNGLQVGRLP